MKKNIYLMIILSITGCAAMQPIEDADKTIEKVVDIPTRTKEQIYTATKIWLAENFVSSKSVIEVDDKESGIIIGNANMKYPCTQGMSCLVKGDWRLNVSLRFDMKDQKFRITFTNMSWSSPSSSTSPAYNNVPLNTKGDIEEVKKALDKMADDIKDSIVKETSRKDW